MCTVRLCKLRWIATVKSGLPVPRLGLQKSLQESCLHCFVQTLISTDLIATVCHRWLEVTCNFHSNCHHRPSWIRLIFGLKVLPDVLLLILMKNYQRLGNGSEPELELSASVLWCIMPTSLCTKTIQKVENEQCTLAWSIQEVTLKTSTLGIPSRYWTLEPRQPLLRCRIGRTRAKMAPVQRNPAQDKSRRPRRANWACQANTWTWNDMKYMWATATGWNKSLPPCLFLFIKQAK